MPLYYFDISDSDGLHRDEFGDECDSIDAARQRCQAILPDIVREELTDGEPHVVTCEVRDVDGLIVYKGRLTFEGVQGPERPNRPMQRADMRS